MAVEGAAVSDVSAPATPAPVSFRVATTPNQASFVAPGLSAETFSWYIARICETLARFLACRRARACLRVTSSSGPDPFLAHAFARRRAGSSGSRVRSTSESASWYVIDFDARPASWSSPSSTTSLSPTPSSSSRVQPGAISTRRTSHSTPSTNGFTHAITTRMPSSRKSEYLRGLPRATRTLHASPYALRNHEALAAADICATHDHNYERPTHVESSSGSCIVHAGIALASHPHAGASGS